MRNNFRNTIGDQRRNQRNMMNSVERKTFTANNAPQSHSRQNHHILPDQLARFITETLLKIPTQNTRASISTTSLKPNQKTLFSTISTLVFGIDHDFQESFVKEDTIMQLMKFWGYPHSINKTVFNPVGAPHTWNTCLQIMYFLAELFMFYFQYKIQEEETETEVSNIDIEFECFKKKDTSMLEQIHLKEKTRLVEILEDCRYKNQSNVLALKNLVNSSDNLEQLEKKQAQLQNRLNRQKQEVIELDQSNNKIIEQIQKIQDQMDAIKMENTQKRNIIKQLQNEIKNQELTPEEGKRMEMEIQDFRNKIMKLKQREHEAKEKYNRFCKDSLDNFFKFQISLSEINEEIAKYEDQLNSHGIDMPRPQANHNTFSENLDATDLTDYEKIVREEIFHLSEIKRILLEQNSLLRILEAEDQQNQITQQQQLNEIRLLKDEVHKIQEQNRKLKFLKDQYQKQIDLGFESILNIDQQGERRKEEINLMQIQKKQLQERQIEYSNEIQKSKKIMMETIQSLKVTEEYMMNKIQELEEWEAETKKKYEYILQGMYQGFKVLNEDINAQ